jgi:small ligand-binding sensory domain FIST
LVDMRFAAAVSEAEASGRAADAVAEELRSGLGGAAADFVCVFASAQHEAAWDDAAARVRRALPGAQLLGCSARSVIGAGRELEETPGIAALAASLPGVQVHPFVLGAGAPPDLPGPDDAHVLLLADPFGAGVDAWLPALDARYPRGAKLGGVASGAAAPGANRLFLGEAAVTGGAAGVVLAGDVEVDTIVAQGCRPVGPPLFLTGVRENVIYELDGGRPLDVLQRIFEAASPAEQPLFRGSLFLGIEMRAEQSRYESGDFLIRNLLGSDPASGALHVAANLEGSRVVQFHLRDGAAAADDLARRLARTPAEGAAGALLFSCLGRGRGLFGEPDHDSRAFARALGPVPLAGFFCNGEIGPVEGRTFLHGYTSAFGIFRPKEEKR